MKRLLFFIPIFFMLAAVNAQEQEVPAVPEVLLESKTGDLDNGLHGENDIECGVCDRHEHIHGWACVNVR